MVVLDCKHTHTHTHTHTHIYIYILLIFANITGMPDQKIMWFIFYDLYCNVFYQVHWLVNALSALFRVLVEHAGTRRHVSIDFNDDTRHVRPRAGVMIQLRGTLSTSLVAFGWSCCCLTHVSERL